jgi:dTDP-glucose 4,6-dehydratase
MKILVTGGAGFIGSNYVNNLVSQENNWNEIIILDSLTYAGNLANLDQSLKDKRVKFIKGDIRNSQLVSELMNNVNTVVHFAAESHVDRSIENPEDFVSTNVLGTFVLLQAAYERKIEKFLHVSTDEVYGSISSGSWTETSLIDPNSPYSASKASSDLLALSYWRTYGLPVFISRCSNNFGPFQFPEKFIPLSITNLIDGIGIPLYGNGLNSRDWLHVLDHCDALNCILEKGIPGEIYNIGGGTELNNLELAKVILSTLGKNDSYIKFVPDRKGHDFRYSVNYEKIANFYAHSSKECQELMECNALVIIDFNKAIENGFVKLTEEINEMFDTPRDE